MDQDKQDAQDRSVAKRRVKVKSSETGRTGAQRAAIKPHKVTEEDNSIPKQVIEVFMGALKPGTTSQTVWGTDLTPKAASVRSAFGLAANDTPYLLLDVNGKASAGMVLSTSGVHLADGRGGSKDISWNELKSLNVSYQRGMLVIGQNGITSKDSEAMAVLLQQIQKRLA